MCYSLTAVILRWFLWITSNYLKWWNLHVWHESPISWTCGSTHALVSTFGIMQTAYTSWCCLLLETRCWAKSSYHLMPSCCSYRFWTSPLCSFPIFLYRTLLLTQNCRLSHWVPAYGFICSGPLKVFLIIPIINSTSALFWHVGNIFKVLALEFKTCSSLFSNSNSIFANQNSQRKIFLPCKEQEGVFLGGGELKMV